jgi:hypothetical protein
MGDAHLLLERRGSGLVDVLPLLQHMVGCCWDLPGGAIRGAGVPAPLIFTYTGGEHGWRCCKAGICQDGLAFLWEE